jgi:hypothetical protein
LFAYSEEILDRASEFGWDVQKADREKAERSNVLSRLAGRFHLIVFNGHGSPNEVTGHDGKMIVNSDDAHLLSGSIVYVRACGCLSGLGKEAVKKGAKALIGYRDELWISHFNEYRATPLKDPATRPVMEVSNLIALKLLKGSSVKETLEAVQNKTDGIVYNMIVKNDFYESATLQALLHNDTALGFEGSEDARV